MALVRRAASPFYHVEFEFKGRRYRRSAKTRSRRNAERFERQLRQQVYEQVVFGVRPQASMTFGAALQRYRDGHLRAVTRRAKTAKAIDYMLDRLVKLIGSEALLHEITTPVVSALKERLLAAGAKPATVNRYLASLRAILRLAHFDWGVIQQVPRIRLYTLRNERMRWLTADEELALLRACNDTPHLHELVVFLIDTGARLGESLELEWPQVHLPESGRGTVTFLHTKSGRPREVPLTQRADALLRRLREGRPARMNRVFLMRTAGCVWRGTQPRAVPYSNPHGAWKTATHRAGLRDVRLHDLRHTFASRLVQREVPLYTVARLLGHQSLRMTMRYSHLAIADLRRAVQALDGPAGPPALLMKWPG